MVGTDPHKLCFRLKEGGPVEFEIELAAIQSARPKKAFRKGVEVLEVVYNDRAGKRQTKSFERMSWAQWASPSGRNEQNSFASFERDISEARKAAILDDGQSSPSLPAADRIKQLQELGALRASGVLTDEEFQMQKTLILGN